MLRKINKVHDSYDATQREPLFLRVSPGGVSAISLTSFLRNGIHPRMAVSPTPLGLFARGAKAAVAHVRRFICDNFIDSFLNDSFISDNLQDEYAIDIYQRTPGRGYASFSTLMEYLLTSAQRGEEIEFSGVRLTVRLPLWMKHIKLRIRRFLEGPAKLSEQKLKRTIVREKIVRKIFVWPNLLKVTDAIKAVQENHQEGRLAVAGGRP